MSAIESIRTCFRKYAVFSGRAHRHEFWWFTGLSVATLTVLGWTITTLYDSEFYFAGDVLDVLAMILALLLFLPLLAVAVRRFHDVGLSGWVLAALWIAGFAGQFILELRRPIEVVESQDGSTRLDFDEVFLSSMAVSLMVIVSEIIICLLPSQSGPNKYGPNPHEVTP